MDRKRRLSLGMLILVLAGLGIFVFKQKITQPTSFVLKVSCHKKEVTLDTLLDDKDQLWIEESVMSACHLREKGKARSWHHKTYYLLPSLPNVLYNADLKNKTLLLYPLSFRVSPSLEEGISLKEGFFDKQAEKVNPLRDSPWLLENVLANLATTPPTKDKHQDKVELLSQQVSPSAVTKPVQKQQPKKEKNPPERVKKILPTITHKKTVTPAVIGVFVDVACNNQKGLISFALQQDNALWVKEEVLTYCQIPKTAQTQLYKNEIYYSLSQIQNIEIDYNPAQLSLQIKNPAIWTTTQVNLNPQHHERIRPSTPGGYINYDATFQYNSLMHGQLAGLTDLVYFNQYGVGNSDFLLKKSDNIGQITRLNTTWTLDQPEKLTSWRLGDSITGTAIWTGAVQFGGIQYATNFATQPGFIPFPLPAFKGQAVVPSTVEFYLDNQLQTQQPNLNGPFEIQGVPAMTGAGELVVQTKDILGRQTVAVLPFYVSQQFLQPGLSSFSYELGAIRQNFGLASNDYQHLLLVNTYQRGFSENWTAGWHSELQSAQQTIGINSGHILKHWLEVDWASAISHSNQGVGGLFLLGLQHRARNFSFGAQTTVTTAAFQQLGLQPDALAPKMLLQTNAGWSKDKWGGFSLSYTNRVGRTEPNIGVATASYTRSLGHRLVLLTNYLYQMGSSHNNIWYVGLIWSPAVNYNAALTYENGDLFENGLTFSFSKNLPTDNGYGYRLVGSTGRYPNAQIDVSAQNEHGLYRGLYSHFAGNDYYEVDASGAMVRFAGQNIFTRSVNSSFVLVQVPEQEDVRVYWSNQLIGRTNEKGFIFIPQTTPYIENLISISPEDLNIDTLIEKDKLKVKPYYQAGELLKFPVYHAKNIIFSLQFADQNVPAGAKVVLDSGEQYFVGYEGKVFVLLTNQSKHLKGTVYWSDQSCRFSIQLPPEETVLHLGNVLCSA